MALANDRGMRPLLAHCYKGLGILCSKLGIKDEGEENLAKALTMFQEMEMDFWLEKAKKDIEFL